MPLVTCVECKKQISDRSENCIGCGAPTSLSLNKLDPADQWSDSRDDQKAIQSSSLNNVSTVPMVNLDEKVESIGKNPQNNLEPNENKVPAKSLDKNDPPTTKLDHQLSEAKNRDVEGTSAPIASKSSKQCPACKKPIAGTLPYCIHCQVDLKAFNSTRANIGMQSCQKCGHENEEKAKFCENCGQNLSKVDITKDIENAAGRQDTAPAGASPDKQKAPYEEEVPGYLVRSVIKYNFKSFNKFSGRADRREYLIFILFCSILSGTGAFLDYTLLDQDDWIFWILFTIPIMLQWIAVSVRRCHDLGKRGFFLLLLGVPILQIYAFYVLAYKESQPGPNQFGLETQTNHGTNSQVYRES